MQNEQLAPAVAVIGTIALAITILSVYISRRYLPRKINQAYRKSIAALAAAVETRDTGMIGYAHKVAGIAVDLAIKQGLSENEVERVEFAALLMEMGKAKVPQSILNKATALTEEEWHIVKNHSRHGAEMVAAVPFLSDVAGYILHHHEYWNGEGYPQGLKGEEIPVASRILHIAGDYVAMLSDRPYHSTPLKPEEARGQILMSKRIKYDPHLVEVFLNSFHAQVDELTDDSDARIHAGVAL